MLGVIVRFRGLKVIRYREVMVVRFRELMIVRLRGSLACIVPELVSHDQ